MEPILEEFKNDYSDEFKTRFIDVRENRTAARKYNIRVIPTQIFFDANGTELFRHEGFYSKEDMLDKWGELGVEIDKAPNDKAD
jgi:thioredoxin 1